ncbi:hypothetical protein A2363_02525 [Candidatus Gottesmanbacteria bacterium RIFOXYB1_FULL_47_11]|uniref:Dipeptidylpeptidase IV N-terminal domain-containing protein n=1 Tax=Candidatus Gottesmanbacteria bacterium RIFOXYB1_FULL_47_11 TaxID=1798401 RepID=A0A1F6BEN7_9BACT|nr:MAG: hypothetical protein A2363_02525 [Candidatus Gottesmanbacteria bacterium RIFOXYB1_FULL_47_11]
MVFPNFKFFNFKWVPISINTGVNNFQEKYMLCPKPTARQPRILYWHNAENGEVVTDLDGNNQSVAFEKDVQLRNRSAIFSPDETKVVALQGGWNEYWIMCTYSHGATKITIPEFIQNHSAAPRSGPSWSPDGEKLIVNLYGDLAIINVITKKIEIIKTNVAFRDNHTDLTSKDRNTKIPAYEVGSVYWARDGKIYYSSFQGDINALHQYDLSDQSDHVIYIYRANEEISILSGDPTGRYLLINAYRVNNDHSFYDFGRNIIFDTKTNKEIEQYDGNSIATIVWSPSGKYFAPSIVSWHRSNGEISIPATYIYTVDHGQDINISALVEDYFIQAGKSFTPGSIAVEVADFINDDQIVARVTFSGITYNNIYASANLIVNFHNKEVKLLQDYSDSQDRGKKLVPIRILH